MLIKASPLFTSQKYARKQVAGKGFLTGFLKMAKCFMSPGKPFHRKLIVAESGEIATIVTLKNGIP
jgi:hypothetical protein